MDNALRQATYLSGTAAGVMSVINLIMMLVLFHSPSPNMVFVGVTTSALTLVVVSAGTTLATFRLLATGKDAFIALVAWPGLVLAFILQMLWISLLALGHPFFALP